MTMKARETGIEARQLEELLNASVALTAERDLHRLLNLILAHARSLTNADAGTLYLAGQDTLQAEVWACQSLLERLGAVECRKIFSSFEIPLNEKSIAGRAAVRAETIVIEDIRNTPAGLTYSDEFDVAHDYATRSMIVVPLIEPKGAVVGVLQLINSLDKSSMVVPFPESAVRVAQAFASQASVVIQNAQLYDQLRESHLDALRTLGVAAEWRDRETANHIQRVALYSALIARAMKREQGEIDLILHASPMHDVGKLGIPDAILQKPGPLTPEERKIMETHPSIGADIMKHDRSEVARLARDIAIGHHEKWDGTGYPNRLSGEAIPLCSRIVAMADVYDALSSRRCYKPPMAQDKVVAIIREQRGRHFDPEIVDVFLANLDEAIAIGLKYTDQDEDFKKTPLTT